jgi:hypothetical protein
VYAAAPQELPPSYCPETPQTEDSDIYSANLLLYWLLERQSPFRDDPERKNLSVSLSETGR